MPGPTFYDHEEIPVPCVLFTFHEVIQATGKPHSDQWFSGTDRLE